MIDRFYDRLEQWYQSHTEQVGLAVVWLLRAIVCVAVLALFLTVAG